jgi:voltage-gated potassium channel
VRARLAPLFDPESATLAARNVRVASAMLALVGIAAASSIGVAGHTASLVVDLVALTFAAAYVVRLWASPDRAAWARSGRGLVHLVAALPLIVAILSLARPGTASAGFFVLPWALELTVLVPGLGLVPRVVRNERAALTAVGALFAVLLFVSATLANLLEGTRQPEAFGTLPRSLWWAMVTLTTTGYGDVVPATLAGRLLGGGLMLAGYTVLALLAGILASGFSEEVRRSEFTRVWGLITKVPLFLDVEALALCDIVSRLRVRTHAPGTLVVRRGSTPDAMYFVVAGEVEVRGGGDPVRLGEGSFFGEIALLERRPRSADIVAVRATTLLVLDAVEFYRIAQQHPRLLEAVQAESRRRQGLQR